MTNAYAGDLTGSIDRSSLSVFRSLALRGSGGWLGKPAGLASERAGGQAAAGACWLDGWLDGFMDGSSACNQRAVKLARLASLS